MYPDTYQVRCRHARRRSELKTQHVVYMLPSNNTMSDAELALYWSPRVMTTGSATPTSTASTRPQYSAFSRPGWPSIDTCTSIDTALLSEISWPAIDCRSSSRIASGQLPGWVRLTAIGMPCSAPAGRASTNTTDPFGTDVRSGALTTTSTPNDPDAASDKPSGDPPAHTEGASPEGA